MLYYFDGFDMHTRVLIQNDVGGGSIQDAGFYWRGGVITRFDFPEGYVPDLEYPSNAMRVTTSGINSATGIGAPSKTYRVGMWSKWSTTRLMNIVCFRRAGLDINYFCTEDGALGIFDQNLGIIAQSSNGVAIDNTWAYYEFVMDPLTATYSISRNKEVIVNAIAGAVYNTGANFEPMLGGMSLSSSPNHLVDHLWITTGEFPAGNDILGVQVIAAADRYAGNDGFRGQLVIDGNRYQTGALSAAVSSQDDYAAGVNYTNVLNYSYMNNPVTDTPWSRAAFNTITQWGLCYAGTPTYHEARVAGVALAYLEYNDGMPLVKNFLASGVTSYSGEWLKSSDTKTFTSLISAVPRPDVYLEADAPSIRTKTDGCILFSGPSAGQVIDPGDERLTNVGITFAEEFREDYKDFVRIDGGTDYDSWFISGYSVLGEGNRKFQDNYLTVNYENVVGGRAYIQGLWDYSENSATGRWSMRQSLDNKGGDYKHAARRIKIRGHGKALQIKVTNKGNNPFVINGWTMMVTSNTTV